MTSRIVAALSIIATALTLATPSVASAAGHTVSGSWTHIAALPSEFAVLTMTGGVDDKLYAFGFCQSSCDQEGGGTVGFGASLSYVFNPASGAWSLIAPAPQICSDAKASALGDNGIIHLAGCWNDIVSDAGFQEALYDPGSDSWAMNPHRGPYVDPIAGMSAPHGRIYWFGETLRNDGSAVFVSGHRIVIGNQDGTWRKRAKEPRNGPSDGAALGSDGRVFVAGGDRDCHPEFGDCAVPAVQAWRKSTNAWRKATVLPAPRIRVAVTSDSIGRIFVIGGLAGDASRLFSRVDVYRPDSRTWARAESLPDQRFEATAAGTPDGKVWLMGGYDEFGNPLSDGYVFTPSD